jgi:hypothetical protein
MFANTLSITFNGAAVTLNRLVQSGYTGMFQGADALGNVLTLEVKHSFPSKPGSGVESHLVKLTYDQYALVDGVLTLTRQTVSHKVIKTNVGIEDDSTSLLVSKALDGFCTDSNVNILLARRS